jgi:hypothetical protein
MMKLLSKLFAACIVVCGSMPAVTWAAFPEGQWTATFNSEVGKGTGVTQGICIQAGRTWFSTTFANWSGKWYLKGNDLHLQGNYAAGAGNDAFELTRITSGLVTGYFQEWRDDNSFNNWGTMSLTFVSATCRGSESNMNRAGSADPTLQ